MSECKLKGTTIKCFKDVEDAENCSCGYVNIKFMNHAREAESEAAFWKERAERLKHTLEQFDHHPLAKDTLQAHTQAIKEREKAK